MKAATTIERYMRRYVNAVISAVLITPLLAISVMELIHGNGEKWPFVITIMISLAVLAVAIMRIIESKNKLGNHHE